LETAWSSALVGARVDLGQHVALLDHLALLEADLDHFSVNPAADQHGVERLHRAETVEINREIALANLDDRDRYGRRRLAGGLRRLLVLLPGVPAEISPTGHSHNDDTNDQRAMRAYFISKKHGLNSHGRWMALLIRFRTVRVAALSRSEATGTALLAGA